MHARPNLVTAPPSVLQSSQLASTRSQLANMEVLDGFMRTLLGGAAPSAGGSGGGTQGVYTLNELGQECYCIDHLVHGTKFEKTMMLVCCWATFAISVAILIFYAFHSWKATCGWEEVYVCIVECEHRRYARNGINVLPSQAHGCSLAHVQ